MKRWLLVGIPLLVLGGVLFIKPPDFSASSKTVNAPTGTSTSSTGPNSSPTGTKPQVGGGGDVETKPRYEGHEADDYGG